MEKKYIIRGVFNTKILAKSEQWDLYCMMYIQNFYNNNVLLFSSKEDAEKYIKDNNKNFNEPVTIAEVFLP